MEISWFRAELVPVKMERDILGKTTAHTMQEGRLKHFVIHNFLRPKARVRT